MIVLLGFAVGALLGLRSGIRRRRRRRLALARHAVPVIVVRGRRW